MSPKQLLLLLLLVPYTVCVCHWMSREQKGMAWVIIPYYSSCSTNVHSIYYVLLLGEKREAKHRVTTPKNSLFEPARRR